MPSILLQAPPFLRTMRRLCSAYSAHMHTFVFVHVLLLFAILIKKTPQPGQVITAAFSPHSAVSDANWYLFHHHHQRPEQPQ